MRLDKYLKVSRLIKRRTVANEVCDAKHVTVNGKIARASYDVKVGDVIEISMGQNVTRARVLNVAETVRIINGREVLFMTEENKVQALPHNLIMENRNRLTVSGVSDVDSFDEQTVVIFTQMGELTVRGSDLHIINLNVDSGELSLEGTVNSLTYSDEQPGKGGFFSRVFR